MIVGKHEYAEELEQNQFPYSLHDEVECAIFFSKEIKIRTSNHIYFGLLYSFFHEFSVFRIVYVLMFVL